MLSPPPHLSIDDILTHPRFPEAFDVFVDDMTSLYAHSGRMRGLLEYRQAVCFQLLVCFDAARDPQNPETLFTADKVAAAMAQMGVHNRRAVTELVGRLRDDGYATVQPAAHDRRVRDIQATEKAREADREWLEVLHRPLSVLEPEAHRYRPPVERDAVYQRAFRTISLTTLAVANSVMETHPEADYFVKANVGARLMMVLIQEARGRPDGWTAPGFYDRAARRCGVSRPHVRKLLLGAQERGMLALSGAPVQVQVKPAFLQSVQRWTAAALSATDLVNVMAWPMWRAAHSLPPETE